MAWQPSTYSDAAVQSIYQVYAANGWQSGIGVALHIPGGQHFVLSVDTERPLSQYCAHLPEIASRLQMFAVHSLDAVSRLFLPVSFCDENPKITPIEAEALRWILEGKDMDVVATKLHVGEPIVRQHLQLATEKLACSNKFQAALKALRLGIV